LTTGFVGGRSSSVAPCASNSASQTLQVSSWRSRRGSCDLLTSDSVWGSLVRFRILMVPPERIAVTSRPNRCESLMKRFGLKDVPPTRGSVALRGPLSDWPVAGPTATAITTRASAGASARYNARLDICVFSAPPGAALRLDTPLPIEPMGEYSSRAAPTYERRHPLSSGAPPTRTPLRRRRPPAPPAPPPSRASACGSSRSSPWSRRTS
jgi:hypothetical protein